jgi:hypothetical protein
MFFGLPIPDNCGRESILRRSMLDVFACPVLYSGIFSSFGSNFANRGVKHSLGGCSSVGLLYHSWCKLRGDAH